VGFISFLLSSWVELRARHNNKLFSASLWIILDMLLQKDNIPHPHPRIVSYLSTEPEPSSSLFLEAQKNLWKNQWKNSRREQNTWKQYLFNFVLYIQKFQAKMTHDT